MTKKTERAEMLKASGKVDSKWEFMAFVWTFRRKEFLGYLCVVQFVLLSYMLLHYTDIFETILKMIKNLIG